MQSDPLFAVQLSPHRAMDPRGVRRVVAFTAALAAVPGIAFFAMGAWPVVGLLGLDVLALYWALTVSLKSGEAFEIVTLWPDRLELRAVSAKGRETVVALNPFFARLVIDRDHEDRIARVAVAARDRQIEIGRFLNADDKARFVSLFAPQLARARA